ncbi:hypothetical protein SAMN05444161_5594 [Rhizobiales bacterium GAS191]|nr:hypothetical protein SAMN05444161_5594 [Rhizobiales bacterium GAS191]
MLEFIATYNYLFIDGALLVIIAMLIVIADSI